MKTILSGLQPSGKLTLGNYIGAIQPFVQMQNQLDGDSLNLLFIANLHAITVSYQPANLRQKVRELAAIYLACGLDPQKTILFIQSEVKYHSELNYLLQTVTYIGELERMTQYKDKKQKQETGVSTALLTYPVLMAADILLYGSTDVIVGDDQKQHLELARDLANRFNNRYSPTFVIPNPIIRKTGSRIMSLQNPLQKMSKSDPNEKGCIYLLDPPSVIYKKIASAVTDSDQAIKYDLVNKPGIANLMTIYSCLTKLSFSEIEERFLGCGYGEFKKAVADQVVLALEPIQTRFNQFINDPYLDQVLSEGSAKASIIASKMIEKVNKKMGLNRVIK